MEIERLNMKIAELESIFAEQRSKAENLEESMHEIGRNIDNLNLDTEDGK